MKALVLHGIGSPLKLENVADPILRQGQALVKIDVAALNHRDVWIQKGQYAGLQFPVILGSDGCGVAESDGPGFSRGDAVIINPGLHWGANEHYQSSSFEIVGLPAQGTFAEYVAISNENVFAKPAHLSTEQAAALPLAGLTAYRATHTLGQAGPGKRVLIHGIGGGVALFALQFALAAGAQVWVTSSSEHKIERALALGAQGGTLYTTADWAKNWSKEGLQFDLIVDGAAGAGFTQLLEAAAPGGAIVVYGGTQGPIVNMAVQKIFYKHLRILGCTMGSPADFAGMLVLVNARKLMPVVSQTFAMEHTEDAMRLMASGAQFGKIVLKW